VSYVRTGYVFSHELPIPKKISVSQFISRKNKMHTRH